jgi:PAS domain S-box-containing protein
VVAVGLVVALDQWFFAPAPFLWLLAAVLISAAIGSLGPGLLAVTLAVVVSMASYQSWANPAILLDFPFSLRLAAFVIVGVIFAAFAEIRHRLSAQQVRLSQIVGSSSDAIISSDLQGNITSWNPAAERLFGYALTEVLGQPLALLLPLQRADDLHDLLDRVGRGEALDQLELAMLRKDLTGITASMTIFPVRNAWGAIIGAATIVRDITLKVHNEAEIRRLNSELEERVLERTAQLEDAVQELERFSYSVSHDLRAPLRAIIGLTEALAADYSDHLDPAGRHYTQRIVAAAEHLDTLVQDLLTYSRISRGDAPLESTSLAEVMADAVTAVEGELRERRATVVQTPTADEVSAHRTALVQAVTNLLSNAVKFVAAGTVPHIHMWVEPRGATVRLWVEDNGIGIAPEHQERIFAPFERLHSSESYPGTGIGLAVVARSVQRMNGQVGVESAIGRGSRFWIELTASPAYAGPTEHAGLVGQTGALAAAVRSREAS